MCFYRVPITQTYINQLRTNGCLPLPGYTEFFDVSRSINFVFDLNVYSGKDYGYLCLSYEICL